MKRILFSLTMMLALVVVAGSVMAQAPENLSPVIGESYSYTVSGLKTNVGDDVNFYVTLATVTDDPSNVTNKIDKDALATTDDVWWTTDTEVRTDITSASQIINIKWKSNSDGLNYKLWVVVTDGAASGCINYRFIPINPIKFNVSIYVVGIGTKANDGGFTDIATQTTTGDDDCISTTNRVDHVWDATSTTPVPADGDVYIYYRITLTTPTTPTKDWKFTPAFPTYAADGTTSVTLTPAFTYEYTTNPGTVAWASTTLAEKTVASTDTDKTVYIRMKRTLITEREENTVIKGSIGTLTYGTYVAGTSDATTADNDAAPFTINPVPQIGTFN